MSNERLTEIPKTVYNKGKPIKCDCGGVIAFRNDTGDITVKCRKCKRIIIVIRAESLK